MLRCHVIVCCLASLVSTLPSTATAEIRVTIRTDHPGGNVVVKKNEGAEIEIAPDQREYSKPWFYWNIATEASEPGRVRYTFDAPGRLGARGPAVSLDDGRTWQWLGLEKVTYGRAAKGDEPAVRESFEYEYTTEHLKVRLAMAVPYQLHDLETFLEKQKDNKNLTRHVLTRTAKGRFVPLLQVGEPGPGKEAMIVTSRNHACESMASYVHEGFLEEASSNSPLAVEFRKRYALFSVPIVDLDGVELGDQGKNRAPHDHNRDYGEGGIYPETRAIQELAAAQHMRIGFDIHCPAVRGDVHEAFYFDGITLPLVKNNVDEFIQWIREERPQTVMAPLNFMKKPPATPPTGGMPLSYYFAYRPQSIFGATLEVPYSQTSVDLDAAVARAYGRALLRAWVRTTFVSTDGEARSGAFADLHALRNDLNKLYRSRPEAVEETLAAKSNDAGPASPYPAESRYYRSLIALNRKQFAEARQLAVSVVDDEAATAHQRGAAAVQAVRIACADPASQPADVEQQIADLAKLQYPAPERQAEAYEFAAEFFRRRDDHAAAIRLARRQLEFAAGYQRGRVLNQIAAGHEALNDAAAALAARREAVDYLRPKLNPVPVSIFGMQMAVDYFDALAALPDTSAAELATAATKVLDHKVASEATKAAVRAKLAERAGKK
jgi:hypothetical protein